MSTLKANVLRLLALCAIARSAYCLTMPTQVSITESFETATDPPAQTRATNLKMLQPVHAFLLREHHQQFQLSPGAELSGISNVLRETLYLEQCNDPSHRATFSGYDYAVLLSMLVISLGIGVFYGFLKGSSSSSEFLLGSEMSVFPVTLSLATSFITAIELLGNPSEMYLQGTQFVLIVIPMLLVIPVAVKIFYPIYFKMELTSCYEYLGIRFGKEIRVFGALLYVIQMCFYTAVAVLAPAIALSKATGLDTKIAVVLIYAVCVFYSSQGGMKAVVIADTFQAAVLALSLILVVVVGYFYSAGPTEIFETAANNARIEFFNFDLDPTTRHTVFSVIIGGFFYWASLFCTNQASVQKCMSLKALRPAKIALIFAIVGLVVVFLLNFYTGLMVFNHYNGCDPLTAGRITAMDQLLPYYIISTYEYIPTFAGIFVAGIFAASLGTVASALNSLSAVTCEDLLVNGMNIKLTQDQGAKYAKWMSLGFGVVSFALVFIVERLGGVLQATLTLNGMIGGVTLGLFVLGMAFKCANTKGAFYGGLLSLTIVIFIGVVAQVANEEPQKLPLSVAHCDCAVNTTDINTLNASIIKTPVSTAQHGFTSWPIFKISYMWYTMLGTLLTIFLGLFISLVLNAIQRHNVLKISSSKIPMNAEPNWKPSLATAEVPSISTKLESSNSSTAGSIVSQDVGHVNHAINIDDE